jgi:type IV pilus assembly protein PilM
VLNRLRAYLQTNRQPLVGVDLGSAVVKTVALSRLADKSYSVQAYDAECISGNFAAWKLKKHTYRQLAIGLPMSAAFSRIIPMNKALTLDEISEQIEIEAHRLIPYSLDEVYYDFEIIGPNRAHAELLDILFVASKIETVNARIKNLQNAGFEVRVVDVESLVMERAFQWLVYQLPERGVNQRIALFDIGAQFINCHVFYNLISIYSRDQSFDAQQSIVAQIQRALQQFGAVNRETELQMIVLAGGMVVDAASQTGDMATLIQTELGIKTVVANPFFGMECAVDICSETLKREAPRFMLAFGLALRSFDV